MLYPLDQSQKLCELSFGQLGVTDTDVFLACVGINTSTETVRSGVGSSTTTNRKDIISFLGITGIVFTEDVMLIMLCLKIFTEQINAVETTTCIVRILDKVVVSKDVVVAFSVAGVLAAVDCVSPTEDR